MSIKLELDEAIRQANEAGEGLWKLSVDIRDCGDGYAEVWLIDSHEFLTASNFMDDWNHNNAIRPIEQAVKDQSGDKDFFFDAYSYAGQFVGSIAIR
ncbi:MAG: hypothetical protein BZ138_06435 [Methanosphaera sp. rholeuAM270]|nr:MAG: hypothetical protein BZ138_06435 [Methanosphaera sp. rholeuAM270]